MSPLATAIAFFLTIIAAALAVHATFATDRGCHPVPEHVTQGKRRVDSRYIFALLAAFFALVIVYGSFVPFHLRRLSLEQALERFAHIAWRPIQIHDRSDFAANVLLFVPLSFCLCGTLLGRGRRSWPFVLVVVTVVFLSCMTLSVAVEFCQLWFEPRTVSQTDILGHAIGTITGVILWSLVGSTVEQWIISLGPGDQPLRVLCWALQLYLCGFVVYCMMPFDLTINPEELYDKLRLGRVQLVPYADLFGSGQLLPVLLRDIATYVPVGVLMTIWGTRRGTLRPVVLAVVYVLMIACCIEAAQLFVWSRVTSLTDVIHAAVGGAIGVFLARLLLRSESMRVAPIVYLRLFVLAVIVLYTVLLVYVFCMPFDFVTEPAVLRERFHSIFLRYPFSGLYWGSEFNAVAEISKKILYFLPLGMMLALLVDWPKLPIRLQQLLIVIFVCITAAVAAGIEIFQIMLPAHVPELTSVILASIGGAIGILLVARIVYAIEASKTR